MAKYKIIQSIHHIAFRVKRLQAELDIETSWNSIKNLAYQQGSSDCCALAPTVFGRFSENIISRNYEIHKKSRFLSCPQELVQNV